MMLGLLLSPFARKVGAVAFFVGVVFVWSEKKANDRVKEFVRQASIAQAEMRGEDLETKTEIEEDIDNASIDELRDLAISGGMFSDNPAD